MTCSIHVRGGHRFLAFAVSLAAALLVGSDSTRAAERPVLYVKRATWTETMLDSRTSYLRLAQQERQRSGNPNAKPFQSDAIDGAGPGQAVSVSVSGCRWMRLVAVLEQGGGNCHIWGNAKLIAKDGTVTWLSQLTPAFVRVGWGQLLKDRNWQDHPLRIGKRQFEHGIWVHANSNVCYALDGKYERFEAWVGMDADRAIGVARFKVLFEDPELLPEIWRRIAADFPAQAKTFADDAGRGYLGWFDSEAGSGLDQAVIQHALGQIGSCGDMLRKSLAELRRVKAPATDRRWLDLYARTCRVRECGTLLDRIWLAELRHGLDGLLDELVRLQVAAEDRRWDEIKTKIGRVSEVMPPAAPLDLVAMRAAIASLAKALPGRFRGAEALSAQLEDQQRQWQTLLPAVLRGETQAVQRIPALAEQARRARRAVLRCLTGMAEFLAIPAHAGMEDEWESQFASLESDLGNRGHFAQVAKETFRQQSLILDADGDPVDVVLRRTATLLADLKRTPAAASLAGPEKELAELSTANRSMERSNREARYVLFADACRVRRQIALRNPLLNFDEVLFIKRHRALFNHMCDQYYGMAATPGGGLYVLSDAFGPNPRVRDVLASSVIPRGRLKGQKLAGGPTTPPPLRFDGMGNLVGAEPEHQGGSFLSPSLSYDGRTVVFAYVECQGDPLHRHHTDPARGHWAEGRCTTFSRSTWMVRPGAIDRWHLERLRPLLAAQRPDCHDFRTARRLLALRPGVPPTPCSTWPPTAATSRA